MDQTPQPEFRQRLMDLPMALLKQQCAHPAEVWLDSEMSRGDWVVNGKG